MNLRRISVGAAALLAALALVQAGFASSQHAALVVKHLGTYRCVQGEQYFEYRLVPGERFLFEVEHHWAGVNLEMARRTGLTTWDHRWAWDQPELWIDGRYHIHTRVAEAPGEFAVRLRTQNTGLWRHATGSCTVQIFVVSE